MIGTNRDLSAMREAVEYELFRLQSLKNLPGCKAEAAFIDRQIASHNRERVVLCAAIINRRIEAARNVVMFARWANDNGALNNISFGHSIRRPANTRAVLKSVHDESVMPRTAALSLAKARVNFAMRTRCGEHSA